MSDEEAYRQAKIRWGTKAFATRQSAGPRQPDIFTCRVGKVIEGTHGPYLETFGYGPTWEQAFTGANDYEGNTFLKRAHNPPRSD